MAGRMATHRARVLEATRKTSSLAPIRVGGVHFDDTATVFKHKRADELAVAAALYRFAASGAVMQPAQKVVNAAVQSRALWAAPVRAAVRRTVFRQFCAGETFGEMKEFVQKLSRENVGSIVDHSIEEHEDPSSWAVNLRHKVALLRRCRDEVGRAAAFVPVKVTALVSPALLEEVTAAARPTPAMVTELFISAGNLEALCEVAVQTGIPILLDAEQTHRQRAIDLIALRLMRLYNQKGRKPAVYNTYQMYLKDASERLRQHCDNAEAVGYTFAAKVVRGAYIKTEEDRAAQLGVPSPIQPSKADTDDAYDSAVGQLVRRIGRDADSCAVLVATHNAASVAKCAEVMEEAGLSRNHERVAFAQILGMCDNVTSGLAMGGYNSHKLVLYGDLGDIVPWLMRRMDENGDSLSAMGQERLLFSRELKRRAHLL